MSCGDILPRSSCNKYKTFAQHVRKCHVSALTSAVTATSAHRNATDAQPPSSAVIQTEAAASGSGGAPPMVAGRSARSSGRSSARLRSCPDDPLLPSATSASRACGMLPR